MRHSNSLIKLNVKNINKSNNDEKFLKYGSIKISGGVI